MTWHLGWHGVQGTLYSISQACAQLQTVPQSHLAYSRNNWHFASPSPKFQLTKVWFWLEFSVSLFLKWDINLQQLPPIKSDGLPQSSRKGKARSTELQLSEQSLWPPKHSSCRNYTSFYHHSTRTCFPGPSLNCICQLVSQRHRIIRK